MFSYCLNNPIPLQDPDGQSAVLSILAAAGVGAVINVVTTFIAAKATGQEYTWTDCGVAFVAGAVNAIPYVGPVLNGIITGSYAGYMCYQSGASIEASIGVGVFAGLCSAASIGNLSNTLGGAIDLGTSAVVDLVFGTGNNTMSAGVYKAVTTNANNSNNKTTVAVSNTPTYYGGGSTRCAYNVRV